MNIKWVFALIFVFLMVPLVSSQEAQQQTLGGVVQGQCINLAQTCSNCTYVNITKISIVQPESRILLVGNFSMTRFDTTYNYTFCDTSRLGEYVVDWKANLDGEVTTGNYNFFVTLTGTQPSTAQATIYFFLGLLSLGIFGLSLYGSIKIKWKHPRDHRGIIVGINDLKYVKLFLWFFTYLLLIFITFAFAHVSRIANWDVASNYLNFMFWFLTVFLLPTFIITVTIGIISFLDAKKLNKLIRRGFNPR